MIYEYAFHPDVWKELFGNRALLHSVIRNVGIGNPCVISNYPDTCALLYKKFIAEKDTMGNNPKKIAKMDEALSQLAEIKSRIYDKTIMRSNTAQWNGSIVDENNRHPFHTILAPSTKKQTSVCQDVAWLQKLDSPFFNHRRTLRSLRNANELTDSVKPLLQNARKFTFVDPYFVNSGIEKPYKAYLNVICDCAHIRTKTKIKVIIVCRLHNGKNSVTRKDLENVCAHIFSQVNTQKVEISVYAIKEISGSQEIHNRYILTEIGGVSFGHGTGESTRAAQGSYEQLSLLSTEDLAHWLNAYKPNSTAFDWSEPPVIIP